MDENDKKSLVEGDDHSKTDSSADLVRELAEGSPPKDLQTVKAASDRIERTKGGARSESIEDRIRVRAYELWEADGWPEGRQADFWLQAETEIKQ